MSLLVNICKAREMAKYEVNWLVWMLQPWEHIYYNDDDESNKHLRVKKRSNQTIDSGIKRNSLAFKEHILKVLLHHWKCYYVFKNVLFMDSFTFQQLLRLKICQFCNSFKCSILYVNEKICYQFPDRCKIICCESKISLYSISQRNVLLNTPF